MNCSLRSGGGVGAKIVVWRATPRRRSSELADEEGETIAVPATGTPGQPSGKTAACPSSASADHAIGLPATGETLTFSQVERGLCSAVQSARIHRHRDDAHGHWVRAGHTESLAGGRPTNWRERGEGQHTSSADACSSRLPGRAGGALLARSQSAHPSSGLIANTPALLAPRAATALERTASDTDPSAESCARSCRALIRTRVTTTALANGQSEAAPATSDARCAGRKESALAPAATVFIARGNML